MSGVASEVAASLPAVVLQGLESLEPVLIISLISSKLSLLRSSSASWYRACRDDWNTGSSSQPRPSHSRSRIMVSAAPGTTRGSSMSSMRSRMESPDLRAESMLRAWRKRCRCACVLMGLVRIGRSWLLLWWVDCGSTQLYVGV